MTALAGLRPVLSGEGAAATTSDADLGQGTESTSAPPALQSVCESLDLSPFERDVLLTCVGVELDGSFASLIADLNGDSHQTRPSFSLLLARLPNAHWSALSPTGPLRYRRLIEVQSGDTLTTSPLRIEERVLHYLTGVPTLDERLMGIIEPIELSEDLVPSHRALADRIVAAWSSPTEGGRLPVVQMTGDDGISQRDTAAFACRQLGFEPYSIMASVVPADQRELDAFVRLWERETALGKCALLVDCEDFDPGADQTRHISVGRLLEGIGGPTVLASREKWSGLRRASVSLHVPRPTTREQDTLWRGYLGPEAAAVNGQVETLVSHFNLSASAIRKASAEALGERGAAPRSASRLGTALWDICRAQGRSRLESLAQRIDSVVTWDDLVLPQAQMETLREIAAHVRHRMRVYEEWGFSEKGSRGLGISALFAGSSGTGKTMAAEVLARELRLTLYRIDLSSVVSKYIGETEKNLRRVFDAAEDGGAILLFDEADALFGKRSEVKDSHDRYANIEISYLLQRMEAYRGLAILTTNLKSALDSAFLRRLRFIVQFPFPDADQRVEIWRRIFPERTPTSGLDLGALARLNVSGGNIRNVALNTAFLAADDDGQVSMRHLLHAARSEYSKIDKTLTDAEVKSWV